MVRWFILFGLLLAAFSAYCATITVTADRNPVSVGEPFNLIFRVEGPQNGEPDFAPLNKHFNLLGTGQSIVSSTVNGKINRAKTYTLTLTALKQGKIVVPAIRFGTDKSKPVTVNVRSSGQSRQTGKDQSFFIRAETDIANPYVQQQIILKVKIYRQARWSRANLTPIKSEGVEIISQRIGTEKTYNEKYQGKNYMVTELRFVVFPQQSGDLTVLPFRLSARVADKSRVVHSQPVKLTIRPIPASFSGSHWVVARDIRLQEAWSSELAELKAGEPVTRTLAIIGDGVGVDQLPSIKLEDIPGIKIYPNQPENQEQADQKGLLSTRTSKFALIPSGGGIHELPVIEIPWWNSTKDKMEIAAIPTVRLSVTDTLAAPSQPRASNLVGVGLDTAQKIPGQQISESPYLSDDTDRWLLFSSLGLLLLWLITLVAWWRNYKALVGQGPQNTMPYVPRKPEKALRNLRRACEAGNPEDVYMALLDWAKAIWPDYPPRSLEAIAQRVPSPLSDEIRFLSQHLYSERQADWDGSTIAEEAARFDIAGNDRPQNTSTVLEPLYR